MSCKHQKRAHKNHYTTSAQNLKHTTPRQTQFISWSVLKSFNQNRITSIHKNDRCRQLGRQTKKYVWRMLYVSLSLQLFFRSHCLVWRGHILKGRGANFALGFLSWKLKTWFECAETSQCVCVCVCVCVCADKECVGVTKTVSQAWPLWRQVSYRSPVCLLQAWYRIPGSRYSSSYS